MESPEKSLPTPPGTAHRAEKENRFPYFPRVAWSERNEIHTISTSPIRRKPLEASGSKQTPTRSILKKVDALPCLEEPIREVTPEPSDPLSDLTYLESCVNAIIATETMLHDLVEAYNTLVNRIRISVLGNTDADASWPLFQPIRKNRDAFVEALIRDLGRATEDPMKSFTSTNDSDVESEAAPMEDVLEDATNKPVLPSPKVSPKKKGMTAEQVKYARDLCSTCHSVLKLLSAAFTMPAIYHIFTEKQLGYMLTHVLAIPMADSLPTPNARKTYALAVWLLQVQRLPEEVLEPAKGRIAYALRRGIEGELGREGKKGSISDGLKAVHDLATAYPSVFVPAFTDILPSIFSGLLGPTLQLRAQACHALGGFAYASASLPLSSFHARISDYTVQYLTCVSPNTPSKKGSPVDDSVIVRTLRTLLKCNDPKFSAQGPVWALCVVANFVVMLRSAVYLDERVTSILTAMFNLVMRHPKSSVRGLGCLAWRTMTWAYFQPALPKLLDEDSQETQDDSDDEEQNAEKLKVLWKLVHTVVELGAGVSTVCALLGSGVEDNTRKAIALLRRMCKLGGQACKDALDTVCQLVSFHTEKEWDNVKLLPTSLFSTNPGLLTAEYSELAQAVRPIINQCPSVDEIRSLTEDELSQPWVFLGILSVWQEGLKSLKLFWGCTELPEELHDIWARLLQVNVKTLTEAEDEQGLSRFACGVVDVLINLLEDVNLDLSSESDRDVDNVLPTVPAQPQPTTSPGWLKYALKMFVVEQLWLVVRDTIPRDSLTEGAEKLVSYLSAQESKLVVDVRVADQGRGSWASLCAIVLLSCDSSELNAFFGGRRCPEERKRSHEWSPEVHSQIWTQFIKTWGENKANWETSILLLAIPFGSDSVWEMTNEHLNIWETFLRFATDTALDYGVDAVTVLDQTAATILTDLSPTNISSTRVADMMLSQFEINDVRQVPSSLFEFVNESLVSSYPPDSQSTIAAMWLLRTLSRTINDCPTELTTDLLGSLQDGLSKWISDEYSSLSLQEYELDVLSLYQSVLVSMQALPLSLESLESLSSVLHATFVGRSDKPEGMREAFSDYWQATYADKTGHAGSLPEKIVLCLEALHDRSRASSLVKLPLNDSDSDALDTEEVEDELIIESEDEEKEATPLARWMELDPTLDLQSPALERPGSQFNPIEIPSTPEATRVPTPTRPHKTPVAFSAATNSPLCSPTRTHSTPKHSPEHKRSPSSGRSRSGKENISPLPVFPSIAERIATLSPKASTLGKRRAPDEEDETASVKRHKRVCSLPSVFEEEGSSLEFLPDNPPPAPAEPKSSQSLKTPPSPTISSKFFTLPSALSRKRKSAFMDAVEVPTVRDLRRTGSLETLSAAAAEKTPEKLRPTIPLRVTRSATRLAAMDIAITASPSVTGRKRRCDRPDLDHSLSSSPLRGLFEPIMAGSDDSITHATPTKRTLSHDSSSDDDPHVGQVTPHRLVSPAMRRVQQDDSDPPSDDSVLGYSPLRARSVRRLAIGKSASVGSISPLALGKRHR